jgi:hypothetical protein
MSKSTPEPSNESPETVSELIGEATKLQAEAARYAKLAEQASKRVTFYLDHGSAIGTAARYVAEKAGVVARGERGKGGDQSPPMPPAPPSPPSGGPKTPVAPKAPAVGAKFGPFPSIKAALKSTEWISCAEAERRSGIDSGTICRAASNRKFRTNGLKGHARRYDADSFQRWVDSRNPRRVQGQKTRQAQERVQ